MEADTAYFRRRAVEERAAAMKAAHPNARQAHLDLASGYDDLVRGIEDCERLPGLHVAHGPEGPQQHT